MRFHPRFVTLSRFADGELRPWVHPRVARHVVACEQCRRALAAIRALPHTPAVVDWKGVPTNLLGRILARRVAGDRVILPVTDLRPVRRSAPGLTWAVVGAAVALLAFSSTTETSTLSFMPAAEDGAIIVSFRSREGVTGDSVFLRARYRHGGAGVCPGLGETNVAVLARRDQGTYHAVLDLRSTVHAVFSLVDEAGRTLEVGLGSRELLVYRGVKRSCDVDPPIVALSRLPVVAR